MSNRTDFLNRLSNDDNARARFVELLNDASVRLSHFDTGTGEFRGIAEELTDAAQRLCEHARESGGRCRYCLVLMGVDAG